VTTKNTTVFDANLLIILGMHRCGTSSLTGVLSLLGFSAGNELQPPNEFNERGYFEDISLNNVLDIFLSGSNSSWRDERAYPQNWLSSPAALAATEQLKNLFDTGFDFSRATVIKNPRISRLLPLIQPIWRDAGLSPKYVLSLRSPLAVIHSLARRDCMMPQRSALLYVAHMLDAEFNTRNHSRVFVEYDDLLQDWRRVIQQIESGLDIDIFAGHGDSTRCARVDAFITKELNHFSNQQPKPAGLAIDLAIEVYDLLRGPINASRLSALDDVRQRWCNYLNSLEPWLSETLALDKLSSDLPSALFKPSKELILINSLNAKSAIYWACVGEEFAEARMLSATWAYDQTISQRFVLPALSQPLKTLRWNITDRPTFCVVEKVWLEDSSGNVQWISEQGIEFFTQISAEISFIGYTETDSSQFMISGFDPQIILSIPDATLKRVNAGWAFCATWQAAHPSKYLPEIMQQLSLTQKQLASANESVGIASDERDRLQITATGLKEELNSVNCRLQQTREAVLRVEGQLALLKDLMLDDLGQDSL
jgi:hypothetical protein